MGRFGFGFSLGLPRRPRGEPVWSPLDLGDNLVAWLDAEDASSLVLSGANVTSWTDRKAGIAVTQSSSGSKPTYGATSFNGRPGITFDGTDDHLAIEGVPVSIPTGADPSELWGLGSQDRAAAVAGANMILSYGLGATSRDIRRFASAGINRAAATANSNIAIENTTDFSGIHIAHGMFDPATVSISVDGGAETSVATTLSTATSRLRIGAISNAAPSNLWLGVLNTVIITLPLTVDETAQLTTYLKSRGGIA